MGPALWPRGLERGLWHQVRILALSTYKVTLLSDLNSPDLNSLIYKKGVLISSLQSCFEELEKVI